MTIGSVKGGSEGEERVTQLGQEEDADLAKQEEEKPTSSLAFQLPIQPETFDEWNRRRLQITRAINEELFNDFYISDEDLNVWKLKCLMIDRERCRELSSQGKAAFCTDYISVVPELYTEQLVLLIKVFQQRRIDSDEVVNLGRRLSWLLFVNPTHCMYELFRLIMKNPFCIQNYMPILERCRVCFEMKVVTESREEILIITYVLRKMFHQLLVADDVSNVKTFSTLVRQLSRTYVRVFNGQQVIETPSLVPVSAIIADLLFTLPFTVVVGEFVFLLLNHMFGHSKEYQTFVFNWEHSTDNESYLRPCELFCFMLVWHNFMKRADARREYDIPFAFKSFGIKFIKENLIIRNALLIEDQLNRLLWAEKFALIKSLGPIGSCFSLGIPEALHRFVSNINKKHYCSLKRTEDESVSLPADFFESLFELAIYSFELTRDLLNEMRSPLFVPGSGTDDLRDLVTMIFMKQTKKQLTIENYRHMMQVLELVIHRFDWPLDVLVDEDRSSLVNEIALKQELITLPGVASLIDIGRQVTIGTIEHQPNKSSVELVSCFTTESNRILSDLMARFVNDQTIARTHECSTPPRILKALLSVCENVRALAQKISRTPLEVPLLHGFLKRTDDFVNQLKAIQQLC